MQGSGAEYFAGKMALPKKQYCVEKKKIQLISNCELCDESLKCLGSFMNLWSYCKIIFKKFTFSSSRSGRFRMSSLTSKRRPLIQL